MTAREFLKGKRYVILAEDDDYSKEIQNYLIEFAKYHVEQAFRQAVKSIDNSIETLSEPEILNKFIDSYPLENIK